VKRLQTGLPDIGTGIPTTPHAIAWNGKVQQPFAGRTREQVARFFTGLDLVEPGLVPVEEWRPHPRYRQCGQLRHVGRSGAQALKQCLFPAVGGVPAITNSLGQSLRELVELGAER
jgi:hypothetical protein